MKADTLIPTIETDSSNIAELVAKKLLKIKYTFYFQEMLCLVFVINVVFECIKPP